MIELHLGKLLLSTENFQSEPHTRRLATNTKPSKMYPANYLMKKFPEDEFLFAMAIQTEVLINFVKNKLFRPTSVLIYGAS